MEKLDISNVKFSHCDIKRGVKIPNALTGNLAYLCGVLAGDGHISKDYNNKIRNTISCGGNPKDEKEFYDLILKKLFKEIFDINIKSKENSDGTYGFKYESKAMVEFFTKIIGLPRGKKYSKLTIPPLFLQDKNLIKQFVRGLFDTDFGFCLCKKYRTKPYYPQVCFDSKSESFTKEIWNALKSFGLQFDGKVYQVYDKDGRTKAGFTITYRFDLYGHKYFLDILQIIGLRHPKHFKKLEEWKEANQNNPRLKKLNIAGVGFEFVK